MVLWSWQWYAKGIRARGKHGNLNVLLIGAEHLVRDVRNCGITPRVCQEVFGT